MENNPYSTPNADLNQASYSDERNQEGVFSTQGRIGRIRYLAYLMIWYFIFMFIVGVAFALFGGGGSLNTMFMIIAGLGYIGLLVYTFIYAARRLNDLDKTGWMSLLMLIPLVNLIMALYLIFAPGTQGMNTYGAPAPENTLGLKILAFMPIVLGILAAIALPSYQDYVQRSQAAQFQQIADKHAYQ